MVAKDEKGVQPEVRVLGRAGPGSQAGAAFRTPNARDVTPKTPCFTSFSWAF
jgi:hypothetical protein